jgi:hypothetical protein
MFSTSIRALAISAAAFLCLSAQDANRARVYTESSVNDIVDRLTKHTGEFKEEFDKAISHSMEDGHTADRAKKRADDLHDSARKLKDVYHDKKDKNSRAVRDQVDRTLSAGADLNRIMQEHRFTEKVQEQWNLLRSDLTALSAVYDLPPL